MQKFEMNVTGSYSNDAMLRQISEGVRIDQVPEGSLINCKNEWNYFHIPRAVVAQQYQWSIGTNGTIGTNGKASYSNGSIGEYASH